MSKRDNPGIFLAVLLIAGGLLGGGFWLLTALSPELLAKSQSAALLEKRKESGQLKIIGDTFSGYSIFRSAAFEDALQEVGIDLLYEDEFDRAKRAASLSRGEADLIAIALDRFVQNPPQGKIVGLIDRSTGADAVVLNTKKYPKLKSLLDLSQLVKQEMAEGRQLGIVFAGDTRSEYLALLLDTKFDAFNLANFQIIHVADAREAWKLLQDPSQNVAIAVLWEPLVAKARKAGYTVVLSSQDAPKAIIDVIVASDDLIQSRPETLSQFLQAYYRRVDRHVLNSSQLQAAEVGLTAAEGRLTATEAAAALQGIKFFTAVEAREWLQSGTLEQRIDSTAAVLVLAGRLNQVPQNRAELFDAAAIASAARNTQSLIDEMRDLAPKLADRLAGKSKAIAPANLPSAARIQQAPSIGNLQVRGEVKFSKNSAQLTLESEQTLDALAREIGEFNPQTVAVRVIGHTSNTGTVDFNKTLSEQRARVVVDYLRGTVRDSKASAQNNLETSAQENRLFHAEGKGFSVPLSGISPEDPRQQRTEIRLVRIN